MADSRQRMFFEIFAKDRGAKKEFDQLGRSVDKAGDSMDDMGKDARTLDKRIETTKKLIHQLGDEFDRTGNMDLLGDLKKRRAELSMLQQVRKELDGFNNRPGKRGIFTQMFDNVGDTLKGLPSQLKGAAIVSAVGIGAVMAPMVGAAIAGAVVGGIGLGGIAGGIAAAASDNRVRTAASQLGHSLVADLKNLGSPFVAPLLAEFGELQEIGTEFTSDLRRGLAGLAPLIKPLVEGLRGMFRNLGPGLAQTFKTAQPVIRALAHELPNVGDAISDMLESISGKSRESTLGMIGLMRATEGLIRATGFLVGQLEYEFSWLVNLGTELDKLDSKMESLGIFKPNLGFGFAYLTDQSTAMTEALNEANDATGDYNTTVVGLEGSMYDVANATDEAHDKMVAFAQLQEDQLDPMLNFIHRLQDVKEAQKEYNEAIKENGQKSPEAKEANLRLAEAILAANTAAAKASGTFSGKLDPALRNTLVSGGMTTEQLKLLEGSARAARRELEKFEGNYKATIEFYTYRAGERDPSGSAAAARDKKKPKKKASGGPVMAGNMYLVGEQGPELVTFGASGTVIPAQRSKAMAASGGAVSVSVSIDPAGARDELAALFLKMLRVNPGFRESVTAYVGAAT